ncbi:MAG: hypothetical protein WD025_04570 [Bacteriovoracaceae bacterium]
MEKISGSSLNSPNLKLKNQRFSPHSKSPDSKTSEESKTKDSSQKSPDYEVDISKSSKILERKLEEKEAPKEKELTPAQQALKIHAKKFGNDKTPGIFFVSGFDWLGASSVKGNYDGIRDMAEAVEGGRHYAWDQQKEIVKEIKKRDPNQPIVLVGHSFGGDAVLEIAQQLNTIENGFRQIDLLVTLDSVGFDNDIVPQNVKENLNFLAQGNKLINDGPNIAANYERSAVTNYLRHEAHAELDDSTDIQIEILDAINKIV